MYFKPDFLLEVRDAMFICKCMNVLCQITVRNADKKELFTASQFLLGILYEGADVFPPCL